MVKTATSQNGDRPKRRHQDGDKPERRHLFHATTKTATGVTKNTGQLE